MREIYTHTDPVLADEFVARLGVDLQDESCPPEINRVGRTLLRWKDQIVNWHHAHVTNAPTEAMNNLIKRIKRVSVYRCSLVSLRRVRAVGVGVGFT